MITRDEFVKNLKTQLDEVNNGIEKVEQKAHTVNERMKTKLIERIRYLREKRDSALSKLQEVKNTSEETWYDLKQGTENVINSLKNTLDKTMAHFKKHKSAVIAGKLSE